MQPLDCLKSSVSKQVLVTLQPGRDLAEPQKLAVDADSDAEIGGVVRSIFQDSRGVLWVGGESDLFRYDGRALGPCDLEAS